MEREVRYCTTQDGVRIAYYVEGKGSPFVWCPTFIESYSLVHMAPTVERIWSDFVPGRQVVRFDHRGTGLSQRDVDDMSIESLTADLEAVVEAAGLSTFCLGGIQASGPYCCIYAARHPKKVRKLVLFNTFARVGDAFPREALLGLANLSRANWDLATRTIADFGNMRRSVTMETDFLQMADWFNKSATGEIVARLFEMNADLDVTYLLPKIEAEVLVVQPLGSDASNPLYDRNRGMAQTMINGIRHARLVSISDFSVGWAALEPLFEAVNGFLDADPDTRRSDVVTVPRRGHAGFRTILFTDLVGHTEMMSRLGDERGRAVLREHERVTREVLKAHGGTEVKTMGDGFMASFGSVTKAVECAVALQRAIDDRNRGVGV